jgi:hypothetical protein
MPPRGFCVTIDSLNGALAWLTVGGAGGTSEAQLWFATYELRQERVTERETQWNAQFQKILKPEENERGKSGGAFRNWM